MDVTALPFGQLIGLQAGGAASEDLLSLPAGTQYTNHLGTVHAGAMLALAEAASGEYLVRHFLQIPGIVAANYVPVVRKLEARFRKPANGAVAARCRLSAADAAQQAAELLARGRLLVVVPVDVVDASGTLALSADVEWFIVKAPTTQGNAPAAHPHS